MTENLMNVMESSKKNEEQLTVLPCPHITEQTMHNESKDEAVSELTSNYERALNEDVATEVTEVMMLSPTTSKFSNQKNEKLDGNNTVEELEKKENVNIEHVHDKGSVLTSPENENDCNTSNCGVNELYTEHEENKVDDNKSCSNHNDHTQCVNNDTTIPSFPHSPSCVTTKTVLPSARPPSRLPHKTPMSSKSATPLSTLPRSPSTATVTAAIVSPESLGSIEQPSIITQSLPQQAPSLSPTSIQNSEVNTHITDTRVASTLTTTNEKHSNGNHFSVKDLTNDASEIVQGKLCNGITSVQNSKDVDTTTNTNSHLSQVNGKSENTSTAKNENIINTSINCRTEVSLQRKRLHEFNTSNNKNNNNHDIKTKANVMQSSTSHLSKESTSSLTTTAVLNNTLSPVNSPSSLIHHHEEQQQSQRLNLIAIRHQRKLQNWSELLVKAIMQHECENQVNMDSVREICTRIAHAIPGDAQAAKDTLLMLLVHLRDPENGELRQRLITGTLPVEVLITMDEHDLVNLRRRRKLDEEFEERAKDRNLTEIKKAMQTTSRLFACPVCKERDCSWYQKQTRSADEPMTIFCTCNKCNTTWKRY